MTIATLGAFAIDQMPEAVAVMLFYVTGELFQDIAVGRSRKSIKALLEIKPEYANLLVDGVTTTKVSPESVKVGDTIIIKAGEKVPLDGEIIDGNSFIDTSTLTGESVPRKVKEKNTILSGMINQTGVLKIKVTKIFRESSVSKILELVENASSKNLFKNVRCNNSRNFLLELNDFSRFLTVNGKISDEAFSLKK